MAISKKKSAQDKHHYENGLIEQFRKSAAKPDKNFIKKALKLSKEAASARPATILDKISYKRILKAVSEQ